MKVLRVYSSYSPIEIEVRVGYCAFKKFLGTWLIAFVKIFTHTSTH